VDHKQGQLQNVDLNTATVEQLNALGAGMIGKRILEFRPYASTAELLTRRVLKRADYETIKGAVTVRYLRGRAPVEAACRGIASPVCITLVTKAPDGAQ